MMLVVSGATVSVGAGEKLNRGVEAAGTSVSVGAGGKPKAGVGVAGASVSVGAGEKLNRGVEVSRTVGGGGAGVAVSILTEVFVGVVLLPIAVAETLTILVAVVEAREMDVAVLV